MIYSVATSLALPFGFAYIAAQSKYRPLLGRFRQPLPKLCDRPLWVHACSVGEVRAARPIIEGIRSKWPGIPVVLTVSTIQGKRLAETLPGDMHLAWLPFDHPALIRHCVRQLNPLAVAIIETELWPALIWETRKQGIPVVLLNGRLSDKHYTRYYRYRYFVRAMVSQLSGACMQNQDYVDRILALGASPDTVWVGGNVKYDAVSGDVDSAIRRSLIDFLEHGDGYPLLVFGSTRPGDEQLAAECWRELRDAFPTLKLVIAPRHLTRVDEAIAAFGEPVARRSAGAPSSATNRPRVFILDTMGELSTLYSLASIAVIGGSFFPGVDGHNPIEPAAFGVPVVFGPHMANFKDAARALVEDRGACQVTVKTLADTLRELLSDPYRAAEMGRHAREITLANQGAVGRTLDVLARVAHLPRTDPATSR
ncbi:MAG: 3-deoxy-D-manno-octulosonic acid transferase [Candidatus Hydrogenedentes bacterium]|nr:3-deoxy-D-manno-octulosonic acid transferase [Candidatus Hydrogenedentota bacterium]